MNDGFNFIKWLATQLQRFVLALLFLAGAYTFTLKLLFSALSEGEIVKAVVGAFLSGILVPITSNIFQFYFRTSSANEKKEL